MVSGNVYYLEEHGPATANELPFGVTRSDKIAGLRSFTITGGRGEATAMGGSPSRVCYLAEHDREAVVRLFLEMNPALVESKTRHALLIQIGSHGSDLQDAAREVTREFFDCDDQGVGGSKDDHGECPACGTYIEGQLPAHLRNECSGIP